MPMLSELGEYKRKIINIFMNDQELVDLVSCKDNYPLPANNLIGKNFYMYDYIDETVKDQLCLVCIEIDESNFINPQARYFDLHIYVAVHKKLMEYTDKNGKSAIRRDAICARIDALLNGRTDLGFGKVEAAYGGRIVFADDFRAKDIHYRLKGWNLRGEALDRTE